MPARTRGSLPSSIVGDLPYGTYAVLATAAAGEAPTTTLLSWLTVATQTQIAFALDRRGLAYRHARMNPLAALELAVDSFVAAVRGRLSILTDELRESPLPAAGLLLTVEEVRLHTIDGVTTSPPTFEFDVDRTRYHATQRAIVEELRTICVRKVRGEGLSLIPP
jgi:hypothetical protein